VIAGVHRPDLTGVKRAAVRVGLITGTDGKHE
jgi:hypothetical protein